MSCTKSCKPWTFRVGTCRKPASPATVLLPDTKVWDCILWTGQAEELLLLGRCFSLCASYRRWQDADIRMNGWVTYPYPNLNPSTLLWWHVTMMCPRQGSDTREDHSATAHFIRTTFPYIDDKARAVNPHWLCQLPPGQPANSSLNPQQPGRALQWALLVGLHNQGNYIINLFQL